MKKQKEAAKHNFKILDRSYPDILVASDLEDAVEQAKKLVASVDDWKPGEIFQIVVATVCVDDDYDYEEQTVAFEPFKYKN